MTRLAGLAGTPVPDAAPSVRTTEPSTFEWLLDPVGVDEFLDAYWETEALLIQRDDPHYFAALPGLDDLDELITATTSGRARSIGDGRLVKTDAGGVASSREIPLDREGIPDIQHVYRAYSEGHTLVLNRLHRRSSAVSLLCRAIEGALHHPVGANLYLTPRHGQGFRPHVDTHDVFILQLHGVKEWHVADPVSDLPLESQKHHLAAMPSAGFRSWTVSAGDVLYLPRGFPHEAMTTGESSVHLTVGVHVYRWVDLLREALDFFAEDELEPRQALPPAFLDDSLDGARLSELATRFARALTESSLADRAKERLGTGLLGAGKAAGRGHFRSLDGLVDLTSDAVVARVPGLMCRVRTSADEATIEFATNYVSGPPRVEPALRFVAEHERFAVGELPGAISVEDKLDLVSRLVAEGLLQHASEQREVQSDGR